MAITGSSSSVWTPDVQATGAARVVVGITALDDTAAAAAVLDALRTSLAARADTAGWPIVVARSDTPEAHEPHRTDVAGHHGDVIEAGYARQPSDALAEPYHGQPGRARAVRAILDEARARGAVACILMDGRSAEVPGWMDGFAHALVAEDLDLVASAYARHPFTGAIVGGIVRPMFRALYGVRLQHPLGLPIACSARLVETVAADSILDSDAGQIGFDLWLCATAASHGYRVGESLVPALADERPHVDLGTTITQVVGFLFADMEQRVRVWQRVRGSRAVPHSGGAISFPERPDVDVTEFIESFRQAHRDLQELWAGVLPPLEVLQWRRLAAASPDTFRVDDSLWARTVYDFAMGHRLRVIARDHLLQSLTPMYLAWLASFILEMRFAPAEAASARLERLCQVFEAEKPYLVSQWRWPERFRPVKARRG